MLKLIDLPIGTVFNFLPTINTKNGLPFQTYGTWKKTGNTKTKRITSFLDSIPQQQELDACYVEPLFSCEASNFLFLGFRDVKVLYEYKIKLIDVPIGSTLKFLPSHEGGTDFRGVYIKTKNNKFPHWKTIIRAITHQFNWWGIKNGIWKTNCEITSTYMDGFQSFCFYGGLYVVLVNEKKERN